jgi:hypothetical protein
MVTFEFYKKENADVHDVVAVIFKLEDNTFAKIVPEKITGEDKPCLFENCNLVQALEPKMLANATAITGFNSPEQISPFMESEITYIVVKNDDGQVILKINDVFDYFYIILDDQTLKQFQKEEALNRMHILKLHENVINEFDQPEDKRVLNLSEPTGGLYWLNDEEKAIVSNFENKYNATVYHVIKSYTNLGLMYSLLYVSKIIEEWKDDVHALLVDEGTIAYVYNKDYPDCSEFGFIGVEERFGGIVRTW